MSVCQPQLISFTQCNVDRGGKIEKKQNRKRARERTEQNRTEQSGEKREIILRTWFVETGSVGEEKEKEVEDI